MKIRDLAWSSSLVALALAAACGGGSGDGSKAAGAGGSGGTSAGSGGVPANAGAPDNGGVSAEGGEAGLGVTVTAEPPTLIQQTPAPNADNVWLYDPIVLVFSEALDPATVRDDGFSLQVAGEELAKTITLSKDGTTVTLQVTAPPITPTDVSLDVKSSLQSAQGAAFAGQSWAWHWPLWQVLGSAAGAKLDATLPAIALGARDQLFVASLENTTLPNPLHVSSWDGSAWHDLGQPLNVSAANAASAPSLIVGADGQPVVAWGEPVGAGAGKVYVAAWSGTAWSLLGGAELGTSASPALLAADSTGQPVVAWLASATELDIERWKNGAWQAVGTPLTLTADTFGGFGFAMSGDTPVVAYYDVNQDLAVKTWVGTSWAAAGAVIDRQQKTSTGRPSVSAATDGTLYVAYLDGDSVSSNGYVRHLPPAATTWVADDGALDVVLDAEVKTVDVRATADGPVATWVESYAGSSKVYAARFGNAAFQALGPALSASRSPLAPGSVLGSALAVDSHGNAQVVYQEKSQLGLARYNGSPQTPYGLDARVSTAACVIPDDTSPAFPQTLSDTGCYADVAKHAVIAGAVPFEINSALWSDGALKQRFIVLPDKSTIGYTPTGAWLMPVGTIIIKEFLYLSETTDPSSLFPMETRFLVKRCEEGACVNPWQGYSYQWNQAGTEATLLPGTSTVGTTKDWPSATNGVANPPHTHSYPARNECLTCHNAGIGRVLGIQTPQLNRSHDYGTTIDNELRTLDHIGLFGSTFPTTKLDQIARLPTPNDPGFVLEQRARGYFHSNCSHCHSPQGQCPQIDFRFYGTGLVAAAPLVKPNICNELVIGNHAASALYTRDLARGTAPAQMPPLATLIPDARQLPITASWIDTMKSCP